MTSKEYYQFLLTERKRQNDRIDFTVEYCRLLCMIKFKKDFDEKVFNKFTKNKKDRTILFEINEEKEIVFEGEIDFETETSFYERTEEDFFVDQFCEADAVMQLHSRIYVDGVKLPLVKAVEILGLTKKTFYKFVPTIGKQYEVNGHIVERVLIE